MTQLVLKHVRKQYPTRAEPLVVLRDVNLTLSAGENAAILGPSGSGKSTLLQAIGTLDPPTEGTITLDGQNPYELAEPALASFRNHRIGFVFQDHHLLPQLSVIENVLLPTLAEGRAGRLQQDRARELIDRVGLTARIDHRPAELSGGERQRAAFARALIHHPELLLADEPTGNLDRTTAASLAELMLELQAAEHSILLVVTHSHELASRLQRQYELADGALVELAKPAPAP